MVKAEFVKALKEKAGMDTLTQAEAAYDGSFFPHSGRPEKRRRSFRHRLRQLQAGEPRARTGRNPRTGQEIKIPASKTVKFTPGKALKESL